MAVIKVEDLTIDDLKRAGRLSATDGIIALALWINPFDATACDDILVPVSPLTQSEIAPIRDRLTQLLGLVPKGLLEDLEV